MILNNSKSYTVLDVSCGNKIFMFLLLPLYIWDFVTFRTRCNQCISRLLFLCFCPIFCSFTLFVYQKCITPLA